MDVDHTNQWYMWFAGDMSGRRRLVTAGILCRRPAGAFLLTLLLLAATGCSIANTSDLSEVFGGAEGLEGPWRSWVE
ncbi:MAG TPA: hypothetical protein VGB51_07090, partial [Actinomycetota bacterium]